MFMTHAKQLIEHEILHLHHRMMYAGPHMKLVLSVKHQIAGFRVQVLVPNSDSLISLKSLTKAVHCGEHLVQALGAQVLKPESLR